MAGREDFIFPPEAQEELAGGIPNAHLVIIDRASHSPHLEQPIESNQAVRDFLANAKADGS
jgi:proline iminopeptidase